MTNTQKRELKRHHSIIQTFLVVFSSFLILSTPQAAEDIWGQVKQQAEKSDYSKALWRELKKLPPKQLLKAGEQFCQQEAVEKDPFAHVVTVNAILSYHQDKTSYKKTANVVSNIVRNSETAPWIYGAVKWAVTNEHWRMIPRDDLDNIGISMAQRLTDSQASPKMQKVISRLCSEHELYMNWSKDTLQKVYQAVKNRLRNLEGEGKKTKSIRKRLNAVIEEIKPRIKTDRFKDVHIELNASGDLSPGAVTILAETLCRYGYNSPDIRRQAVVMLGKLKGRDSVPEACKTLFKIYENEPNKEIREKMVEALKTIDPKLKETKKQAKMHSWLKTKELWEKLSLEQ